MAVIGASLAHGDLVLYVTQVDGPTWLVVGITEWADGSYTYRLRHGVNQVEAMAVELTPAMEGNVPINLENFKPGEGMSAIPGGEEDEDHED